MKTLNLGCGAKKRAGEYGVDVASFDGVDLVADVFDGIFWGRLPRQKWGRIVCFNVLNYAPSRESARRFLSHVHNHLSKNGNFEVHIVNWFPAWEEKALMLNAWWLKRELKNAGFSRVNFLTPRHFIIPTGNVKMEAFK